MGTMGLRKWRRQELGGSAIESEIPNVEFLPEQVMQHMQKNKVVSGLFPFFLYTIVVCIHFMSGHRILKHA